MTGSGGTGCGRAIAVRLASLSASVVVSDIDDAGGEETVRLIRNSGGRATFLHADVCDEQQVRQLVVVAEETFGDVGVLVNNASGPFRQGFEMDHWANTAQTEFIGTLHATRYAVEAMRRHGGGAIVNIASISALWHGRKTEGGAPVYDAAKAGLLRLTTGLAGFASADNIRVNCLAPGWIATDGPRQVLGVVVAGRAPPTGHTGAAVDDGRDRQRGDSSRDGRHAFRPGAPVVVRRRASPDRVGRPRLS